MEAVKDSQESEEHVMKRLAISAAAVLALFVGGCQPPASDTTSDPGNDTSAVEVDTHLVSAVLCGKCGHAKGSETCCDESGETCDCGFHKGSALCCKGVEGGQDYCTKCGEVADSETCCAEGVEACECGMHKGSPLCCKLVDKETAEESTEG